MTTLTAAMEAERECRAQRLRVARAYLTVDETLVTEKDKLIVERIIQTMKGDGSDFDKALAHPETNKLYLRGVLKLREQPT